jgi:hypothetical protein
VTPVTTVSIVQLKRQYPHVNEVKDFAAGQSIRLLWDRIFQLQEQLTAAQATIAQLVAANNLNEAAIETVDEAAQQALALSQKPGLPADSDTGGGGGGGEPELPGGGDGGGGATGCAGAGPSGHDSGGLLTPIRAGQIVCGTGNEWAQLKNPAPDLDARHTMAEELLRRMIWHLRLAGFSAGRQQNPSGAISKDKLCVVVNDVLRVYDVFLNYDTPSIALQTQMHETAPAVMIDDEGIPD